MIISAKCETVAEKCSKFMTALTLVAIERHLPGEQCEPHASLITLKYIFKRVALDFSLGVPLICEAITLAKNPFTVSVRALLTHSITDRRENAALYFC